MRQPTFIPMALGKSLRIDLSGDRRVPQPRSAQWISSLETAVSVLPADDLHYLIPFDSAAPSPKRLIN